MGRARQRQRAPRPGLTVVPADVVREARAADNLPDPLGEDLRGRGGLAGGCGDLSDSTTTPVLSTRRRTEQRLNHKAPGQLMWVSAREWGLVA
jgi:hypothetical protein